MGTKTKFFANTMTGAPAMTNAAGSLIAILDAVLVNGWGSANVQALNVAGGIATATFAAAHPYQVDSVALFAGSTPVELNGEKRVLSVTANAITFAAPGVADGAATGAITAKVAPAGWTKLYAGVNLAVYKPSAPEASGCVLRVDDTSTTAARVRGYEAMSDINTGTGPFPSVAQIAAPGLWWSKSSSATERPWRIFADDRGFYWCPRPATNEGQANYFGDLVSLKSNDPYACVLRGNTADRSTSSSVNDDLMYSDNSLNTTGGYVARAANALGGAAGCFNTLAAAPYYNQVIGNTTQLPYPNPTDNGLAVAPIAAYHSNGQRGWYPGIYGTYQGVSQAFNSDDVIDGTGAMTGRKLRAWRTGGSSSGSLQGMLFFDPVADWR